MRRAAADREDAAHAAPPQLGGSEHRDAARRARRASCAACRAIQSGVASLGGVLARSRASATPCATAPRRARRRAARRALPTRGGTSSALGEAVGSALRQEPVEAIAAERGLAGHPLGRRARRERRRDRAGGCAIRRSPAVRAASSALLEVRPQLARVEAGALAETDRLHHGAPGGSSSRRSAPRRRSSPDGARSSATAAAVDRGLESSAAAARRRRAPPPCGRRRRPRRPPTTTRTSSLMPRSFPLAGAPRARAGGRGPAACPPRSVA